VNSERSPSRTSWISRTYGGSGSAPCRLASGIAAGDVEIQRGPGLLGHQEQVDLPVGS
jgi:hypothetical protein